MESWNVEVAAEHAIAILAEWLPDHADPWTVLDAILTLSQAAALDFLNVWIDDRAAAGAVLDTILGAIERG